MEPIYKRVITITIKDTLPASQILADYEQDELDLEGAAQIDAENLNQDSGSLMELLGEVDYEVSVTINE